MHFMYFVPAKRKGYLDPRVSSPFIHPDKLEEATTLFAFNQHEKLQLQPFLNVYL